MTRTIGIFGAGPGLGQAVAHRYAGEGYDVVLVGRRREPLDRLARELAGTSHVVTAYLADTGAVPALAAEIRATAGELDALYYAPTADGGFVSATDLTAERAQLFMPLAV